MGEVQCFRSSRRSLTSFNKSHFVKQFLLFRACKMHEMLAACAHGKHCDFFETHTHTPTTRAAL